MMAIKNLMIIALIFGLLISGISFALYQTRKAALTELAVLIDTEQQKNDIALEILALSSKLDDVYTYFLRDVDTTWFMNEIASIAQETGVELSFIEPLQPRVIDNVTGLSVKIGVVNRFSEIGSLLAKIESYPKIIKIDHLRMSSHNKRTHTKEDKELYSERLSSATDGEWLKRPRTILIVTAYALTAL